MCVDIDGNDWHIWNSLKNYKPKALVVEFNFTMHNDVYFVQEANNNVKHGSSCRAFVELGKEKGYELVCCNGYNAFFVDQAYYNRFDIEDNSIYKIRTFNDGVTHIFSGLDGTTFVQGSCPYGIKKDLGDGVVFPLEK
jgi:hypothetical protein